MGSINNVELQMLRKLMRMKHRQTGTVVGQYETSGSMLGIDLCNSDS